MLVHHSEQDYNVAASAAAKHARQKMEEKIERGKKHAGALLDHIENNVPQDDVVKGPAFEFTTGPGHVLIGWPGLEEGPFELHPNALGQLAERTKININYLRELQTQSMAKDEKGEEAGVWARALLVHTLTKFARNHPNFARKKFLVRTVNGETRGILSDQYRRLDSRPLLHTFANEASAVGAVPVEATITDTRAALKVFLPYVFEPVPNEVMCVGAEWFNSDYGNGKFGLRMILWRLWCTNFCTGEDSLSQVHLGGKLSEDISFSKETYELDTKTQVSATKDVMASLLHPDKVHQLLDAVRAANEEKVAWTRARGILTKYLGKKELEDAQEMFEDEEDFTRLPPAKSLFKVSNICSWFAQRQGSPDKKLELERAAGSILMNKSHTYSPTLSD